MSDVSGAGSVILIVIRCSRIWDEDPRWVDAQYRLVVWSVAFLGIIALLASAFTRDWTIAAWYFGALGIVIGGLCIYGAVVLALCWGAVLLARFWRSIFHRHENG